MARVGIPPFLEPFFVKELLSVEVMLKLVLLLLAW